LAAAQAVCGARNRRPPAARHGRMRRGKVLCGHPRGGTDRGDDGAARSAFAQTAPGPPALAGPTSDPRGGRPFGDRRASRAEAEIAGMAAVDDWTVWPPRRARGRCSRPIGARFKIGEGRSVRSAGRRRGSSGGFFFFLKAGGQANGASPAEISAVAPSGACSASAFWFASDVAMPFSPIRICGRFRIGYGRAGAKAGLSGKIRFAVFRTWADLVRRRPERPRPIALSAGHERNWRQAVGHQRPTAPGIRTAPCRLRSLTQKRVSGAGRWRDRLVETEDSFR